MPDEIALQDAPTDQPRTWLEANVTLIPRIAIQAARRHRLPPQDRQELLSIFWTHLAKDDCRVLRQFRGSSGIATYLRTVIGWCWTCGPRRGASGVLLPGPGASARRRRPSNGS